MTERHPELPEPAHGPTGEHGGLEDLSALRPQREASAAGFGRRSGDRALQHLVGGGAT